MPKTLFPPAQVVPPGTVAAPGLYFWGDSNTGLYSPGPDQIGVSLGGVVAAGWSAAILSFYADALPMSVRAVGAGGANNGGRFNGRSSRGTILGPTATQSGDELAYYGGLGYGATQFSASNTGLLKITATQNFTDSAMGTRLEFWTTPNGSATRIERGRFDQDGILYAFFGVAAADLGMAGNQLLVSATTADGPFLAGHTNQAGASTINTAAMRALFGSTGLIIQSSPATAPGTGRTWTSRFTIDPATGLVTIAAGGLTVAAGALSFPAGAITPAMVNPTRIALKGGSLTVTSTSGTNPFTAANGGSEEAGSAPIAVDGTITFTAGTAGTYLYIITATGRHTDTNGTYATLRMLKNAASVASARQGATNTATVDAVGWALSGVLPFVNGDVVTFEITKNGSNTCVLNDVAATLVRIA